MSRYTEKILPARQREIDERLAQFAHITYSLNGETIQTIVKWYGYPKQWPSWSLEQRVEWWRAHCVRMFVMPLTAKLEGVTIYCGAGPDPKGGRA